MEDILNEELRLDRDESEPHAPRGSETRPLKDATASAVDGIARRGCT